jgi:hypothetical protein
MVYFLDNIGPISQANWRRAGISVTVSPAGYVQYN